MTTYYKGLEVTPETLALARDFHDVFKSEPGQRVLRFLAESLQAGATVELTPFQQGQAAAYNKIVLYRDMHEGITVKE